MTGGRRWSRLALVTCAAVLALASGCGDEKSPGEAVPALADRLDRVDQAIEAGDYTGARAQLDRLVAETAKADVAGEISEEQADRILDAVADVLAAIPSVDGGSESSTDPPPDPEAPADEGDPGGDEEGAEDGEDDKDKDKKDKDKNKDDD